MECELCGKLKRSHEFPAQPFSGCLHAPAACLCCVTSHWSKENQKGPRTCPTCQKPVSDYDFKRVSGVKASQTAVVLGNITNRMTNEDDVHEPSSSAVKGPISFALLDGQVYPLQISPVWTVNEVKAKINQESKLSLPVKSQRLFYDGREIANEKMEWSRCKVPFGSTVQLVVVMHTVEATGPNKLVFELSWTPNLRTLKNGGQGTDHLNGTCFVMDENLYHNRTVDFQQRGDNCIWHSGPSSFRRPEQAITVCLDKLLQGTKYLFFALSGHPGCTLEGFVNPTVMLKDAETDASLEEYRVDDAGTSRAIVMCYVYRDHTGNWIIAQGGKRCDGHKGDYSPIVKCARSIVDDQVWADRPEEATSTCDPRAQELKLRIIRLLIPKLLPIPKQVSLNHLAALLQDTIQGLAQDYPWQTLAKASINHRGSFKRAFFDYMPDVFRTSVPRHGDCCIELKSGFHNALLRIFPKELEHEPLEAPGFYDVRTRATAKGYPASGKGAKGVKGGKDGKDEKGGKGAKGFKGHYSDQNVAKQRWQTIEIKWEGGLLPSNLLKSNGKLYVENVSAEELYHKDYQKLSEKVREQCQIPIDKQHLRDLQTNTSNGFRKFELYGKEEVTQLYFTQDTICSHFQNGWAVQSLTNQLTSQDNPLDPLDLEPLEVVFFQGKWRSLCNRRLYALRSASGMLNKPLYVRVKICREDEKFYTKNTSKNDGQSVQMVNSQHDRKVLHLNDQLPPRMNADGQGAWQEYTRQMAGRRRQYSPDVVRNDRNRDFGSSVHPKYSGYEQPWHRDFGSSVPPSVSPFQPPPPRNPPNAVDEQSWHRADVIPPSASPFQSSASPFQVFPPNAKPFTPMAKPKAPILGQPATGAAAEQWRPTIMRNAAASTATGANRPSDGIEYC